MHLEFNWHRGRYGSADDWTLPREHSRTTSPDVSMLLLEGHLLGSRCLYRRLERLNLVRIDGERTTKRPPRSKGEVTTGGCWRMAHAGAPNRPKPSAAAVIHMG